MGGFKFMSWIWQACVPSSSYHVDGVFCFPFNSTMERRTHWIGGSLLTLQWEYVNSVTASSEQSRICCSLHLFPFVSLGREGKGFTFYFFIFYGRRGRRIFWMLSKAFFGIPTLIWTRAVLLPLIFESPHLVISLAQIWDFILRGFASYSLKRVEPKCNNQRLYFFNPLPALDI